MFEQDYIMRLIHEMVRAVMKLLFRIDEDTEQQENAELETSEEYETLIRLADAGKINEAENMVYEQLDGINQEALKRALLFYEHLNQYTEEALAQAGFTREEIREGICHALKRYGYEGMTGLFTE